MVTITPGDGATHARGSCKRGRAKSFAFRQFDHAERRKSAIAVVPDMINDPAKRRGPLLPRNVFDYYRNSDDLLATDDSRCIAEKWSNKEVVVKACPTKNALTFSSRSGHLGSWKWSDR